MVGQNMQDYEIGSACRTNGTEYAEDNSSCTKLIIRNYESERGMSGSI